MKKSIQFLAACFAFATLSANSHAWVPNEKDLGAAITSGDFTRYEGDLKTWLVSIMPAVVSEQTLKPIMDSPTVALALAQRQFIAKVGPNPLGAFAKADPANKTFLIWLLNDSHALHEYLLGATPLSIPVREDNSYGLSTNNLETWKKIFVADPDSRKGIPLRIAIATALRPPGTGSPGSGQQKVHSAPLVRYAYFKNAQAKKEL
ncbi:MAG: hypothetical protein WCN98_13350, partial [Verrucomicrobiaceae bacterium]